MGEREKGSRGAGEERPRREKGGAGTPSICDFGRKIGLTVVIVMRLVSIKVLDTVIESARKEREHAHTRGWERAQDRARTHTRERESVCVCERERGKRESDAHLLAEIDLS